MNTRFLSTCLAIMLLFASTGHAGQALMDFEYTYSPIGTSYDDLGVSFDGNEGVYPGGEVTNLPSGQYYLDIGSGTTCNVAGGFTGISLYYQNGNSTAATLTVYAGANATGTVLATVSLTKNITGAYNTWTQKTATHATALSFRLTGVANYTSFDDIRLTGAFKPHAFYVPTASSVGKTSATLGTTMNPSGDATSVIFGLSTDGGTSYTLASSSQNIGSGTTNVTVTQVMTGLTPGTQYTFFAQGTNSAGYSSSWTNTFTTLQTTATTLPASSVTASSAVLNGSVNPAGDATSVFFQYATNASLTGATSTTAQNIGGGTTDVAVNAALTGLAPGIYYYRVVATNAGGTFNGSISSVSLNPGYTVNGASTGTFTDISGTGTQVFGADVDDSTSPVSVGFPFEFIGTAYTSLYVSSNGLVSFGGSISTATNIDFAAASPSPNVDVIAALWDDWVTGTAGRVYTQTSGTAGQRVFTVQWNQMRGYGSSGSNPATFQLQLFEATSDILIIAQDTATEVTGSNDGATNGGGASVGIRKAGAPGNGRFLMHSHNSATITSGTKIRFTPLKPVVGGLAAAATASNATLFASVNPNSSVTTASFQYGTTTSYGSTAAITLSPNNGSTAQNVSSVISGLTPSTLYHYRVVAVNEIGTTTSADGVFYFGAGVRDAAFSGDGIQITSLGGEESGQGMAVQSDGKIVVVGYSRVGATDDFTVLRYNTDGTLDASFGGGDGIATVDFSSQHDFAYAVAIQTDGKIVVAGETPQSGAVFAIARLHGSSATGTPGELDTSFDGDGKVTTDFNLNDVPSTIAIQPDGKILVGGYSLIGSTADYAIARYNTDGSLDTAGFGSTGTTFTGGGKVTTAIGSGDDYGNLALQADGKIIMAGRSVIGGANDFSVVRYNSNGTLDTSFDGDGKVTTPIGSDDDGGSKALCQPDGKIVVVGFSYNGSNYDYALVRYLSTGGLDSTFGSGGKVTTAMGGGNDLSRNIALQADGRLVVAGETHNGSSHDFGVARYNPDGTLDTTFDGDGKTTVSIGSGDDVVRGLGLYIDGEIIVAGRTHNGTNNDVAVIRLLGGPMPLLVNAGFESVEAFGGQVVTGFGDWGWDVASTVTAENGITPFEGTRMLKFIGTAPTAGASNSPWCDVPQYVDLSAYAAQIALGNVSVTATARVNRVAGNASTDTRFDIIIEGRSGAVPGPMTTINDVSMISDADPNTWELIPNTYTVPSGTTHLLVGVYAYENVVNQTTTGTEFDGHYADDVTLTVTVRSDIQIEQPVGTILVDGTSTVDFGTTPLGTPVTRTFRVTNTGGSPLNVTGLTLPAGYEHVGTFTPFTLAPNATQDLTVRCLANTVTGTFNGTMTLTSDDQDAEGSFAVTLMARAARVYPGAMAIKMANPAATDGIYTLDPDGPGGEPPFDAYCDMTQFGGGWTMLLKANGSQPTFQYGSALWTNTAVLNPENVGINDTEHKSAGFSTVPFNAVMIGMHTAGTTRYFQPAFATALNETSLRSMFLGAEKLSTSSRAQWLGLTPAHSAFDSHVAGVRGGVNVTAPSNYPSVRLGVLLNNEADNLTPDAFVGMGAGPWQGQVITTSGAANYIHGYHAPGVGFLFVRDTTAGVAPSYAPTMVSQNASVMGASTTILGGTVIPNGIITSAWFEYGLTTSYGSTTGAQELGYGTDGVPVSAILTGLTPGTTYHYRLVAQNGETTISSADMTFTTIGYPVAQFTASPNPVALGQSVVLDASSSFHPTPGHNIVSYSWNFGDGSSDGSGQTTSHAFGMPGVYTVRLIVTDDLNQTGQTTQNVTILTAHQNWRQTYFGTTSNTGNAEDGFDFDNDGLVNLLEWACHLNPTTASTHPVTTVRNGAFFEFTYTRSVAALNAGAVFTVEWSDTLPGTSWSASGVTEQVLSDNGTVQQVRATIPAGSNGRRFAHLKVTTPP